MRDSAEKDVVFQRRSKRLERRWGRRQLIGLFVTWHLFAVVTWLLPTVIPASGPAVQGLVPFIRPYMIGLGFLQDWRMFSPEPDRLDVYLEARIHYADGQVHSWDFPRMVSMDYVTRYREERYRKLVEVATHGNPELWPMLARYAVYHNRGSLQNPAVSVDLVQHSRLVPPPQAAGRPYPAYRAELVFHGVLQTPQRAGIPVRGRP